MAASKVIDGNSYTRESSVDAHAAGSAAPQLTAEMTASIEKFRHAIQLGVGRSRWRR